MTFAIMNFVFRTVLLFLTGSTYAVVPRRTLVVLFYMTFIITGILAAHSSSEESNFDKVASTAAWPSLKTITKIKTIKSDDNSDVEDDDDDSDEDDDDGNNNDEDNVLVQNAIVGLVPVVLGLVAIVILCVFVLCKRNKSSHRIKWLFRNQHHQSDSHRSDRNIVIPEAMVYDGEEWYTVERQSAGSLYGTTSYPETHHVRNSDPPPSYEEVMRGIYPSHSVP